VLDGAGRAKRDNGRDRLPKQQSVSSARSRCQILQRIPQHARGGRRAVPGPAGQEPKSESYAERWVRSVKEECLSRSILFGENSLRRAVSNYLEHFHHERNHQGKENLLLFPIGAPPSSAP
jgi:hypothetical protein